MVSKITFFGFSDVPESFLSSQSHKPFESESSKFFSSQSHDLVESSHKNCRVIGLQARVNVESHEISHFFYYIFYAIKWRPTCYKMAPDKSEDGAQLAIKWRPIGW